MALSRNALSTRFLGVALAWLVVALLFGGCSFNLAGEGDALSSGRDGSVDLDGARAELFAVTPAAVTFIETDSPVPAAIEVRLTQAPTAPVTVPARIAPQGRLSVSPGSLLFTPQNWATPQRFEAVATKNNEIDPTRFTLEIGPATSPDSLFEGADPPDVAITFQDSNEALVISPRKDGQGANLSVSEDATFTKFYVALGATPTASVEVTCTSAAEDELVLAIVPEGSLGDAGVDEAGADAGDGGTSGPFGKSVTYLFPNKASVAGSNFPVTVRGVNDDSADRKQSVDIICRAVSDDVRFDGKEALPLTIDNVDNDTASVIVTNTTPATVEGGQPVTFDVRLTTRPTQDVTINFASADTTEGTVTPSVVFTAASWVDGVGQAITITPVDDNQVDGPISYGINLTLNTADPAYLEAASAGLPGVLVSNADNDLPELETPTANFITTEAGGSAPVSIRLKRQPVGSVQVDVVSTDPSEGTVPVTTLTFTEANWNVDQVVTVTGQQDLVQDGPVSYALSFNVVDASNPTFGTAPTINVSGQNTDDDVAGVIFDTTTLNIPEGEGRSFNVRLQSQPLSNVTISFAPSTPLRVLLSLDRASVTFTPVDWVGNKQVIVATQDECFSAPTTASFPIVTSLSGGGGDGYPGINPSDVTVNFANDDPASTIILSGGTLTTTNNNTDTFTVQLATRPVADVSLASTSNNSMRATVTGGAALTVTGNPFDTSCPAAQTVTVTGKGQTGAYSVGVVASSADGQFNGDSVSIAGNNN